MSGYQWAPYVPVAKRRAQAQKKIEKLKKNGQNIQPIKIEGKVIAKSFWGKAWCSHLEQFSDYSNRLPRGRTYVRNGSVCHLAIKKGLIEAIVSGSSLYNITIKIAPLPVKIWANIQQKCSNQISSVLELLQGKISNSVMQIVTDPATGIFPKTKEIQLDCNCPDWASLCKHLAAVLYGVGARLDHNPELLFLLRGVDHQDLVSTELDITAKQTSRKRVFKGDLTDVFGIELESSEPKQNISVKKSAKVKASPKTTTPKKKTVTLSKNMAKTVKKKNQKTIKKSTQSTIKTVTKTRTTRKTKSTENSLSTGMTTSKLRSRFDMNYTQFAKLLGVSPATIKSWEMKSEQYTLAPIHQNAVASVINLKKQQAWDKLEQI